MSQTKKQKKAKDEAGKVAKDLQIVNEDQNAVPADEKQQQVSGLVLGFRRWPSAGKISGCIGRWRGHAGVIG